MPRKGENIRKRKDGRWEARYIKGRDIDGRRVMKNVVTRMDGSSTDICMVVHMKL